MDPIDSEILQQLGRNARITFSELGRLIGLSTNATAARVRKLEDSGIIRGYTTVLDPEVARTRTALEVYIDVRLSEGVQSEIFLAATERLSEIDDAVHMTGPYDYLVHAWCRDTAQLDRLLRALKSDGGVAQTQTRVVLKRGE
jgi:Lrp/AsnC family leucine-responsive transcriptional regulator